MPLSINASAFAFSLASSSSAEHWNALYPFQPIAGRAPRSSAETAALQSCRGPWAATLGASSTSSRPQAAEASATSIESDVAAAPRRRRQGLEELRPNASLGGGSQRPGGKNRSALDQKTPVPERVAARGGRAEVERSAHVDIDRSG